MRTQPTVSDIHSILKNNFASFMVKVAFSDKLSHEKTKVVIFSTRLMLKYKKCHVIVRPNLDYPWPLPRTYSERRSAILYIVNFREQKSPEIVVIFTLSMRLTNVG